MAKVRTADLYLSDARDPENFVKIAQVRDMRGPAMTRSLQEVTDMAATDKVRRHITDLIDAGLIDLDLYFDPEHITHDHQSGLHALFRTGAERRVRMTFTDPVNQTWTMPVYVIGFDARAPLTDALTARVRLKVNAPPTIDQAGGLGGGVPDVMPINHATHARGARIVAADLCAEPLQPELVGVCGSGINSLFSLLCGFENPDDEDQVCVNVETPLLGLPTIYFRALWQNIESETACLIIDLSDDVLLDHASIFNPDSVIINTSPYRVAKLFYNLENPEANMRDDPGWQEVFSAILSDVYGEVAAAPLPDSTINKLTLANPNKIIFSQFTARRLMLEFSHLEPLATQFFTSSIGQIRLFSPLRQRGALPIIS